MAVSNQTIWEVESGGSDTNGGGFVAGASGTDFSQQTSAQISVSDAVAVGTTTITSATAAFATTSVGNIIYLAGGTGSLTAGWYQCVTRVNSTTITVDRTVGTGTGITLNLGGAFATIQVALNQLIDSQIIYVKAATYSISSVLTLPNSISGPDYYSRIIGYSTTRGDLGRPTITQTAAANGININQLGISLENFIFDGNSGTGLIGISMSNIDNTLCNCYCKNWATNGIVGSTGSGIYQCEVSGTVNGYALTLTDVSHVSYCYIHDNSSGGIAATSSTFFTGCVVANNTGYGIAFLDYNSILMNSLIYGNSSDGIATFASYSLAISTFICNNIFAKNGGYGFNAVSTGTQTNMFCTFQNNGFWNNTTAAVNNITLDSTNILITGTGTTNNPFVSDSTKNWALNNTAGAGALLRAAGFPGKLPGLTTSTGYVDIGPFQHQDPASSGSGGSFTFVM